MHGPIIARSLRHFQIPLLVEKTALDGTPLLHLLECFLGIGVKYLVSVDPGLHIFIHVPEPGSGIDLEVSDEFENGHGHQGDLTWQLVCLGVA